MSSSLLTSFLGALQASLSVLLVICYGVIATQFDLLDKSSSKKVSTVCVKLFLPALLITKVGKELDASNVLQYVAILIWALIYNASVISLSLLSVKLFKLPSWVALAISFNNTTSLPLLLVQSLEATGILERLLLNGESTSDAISRAQSFFLVNAIIGNCLTFAIGPRLMDTEGSPDDDDQDKDDQPQQNGQAERGQGGPDEETSLLPDRIHHAEVDIAHRSHTLGKKQWDRLSPRAQYILDFLYDFMNAPLIGAVTGAIIGLTPPLHKAFFNESNKGGIFTAWLTQSLKDVGTLFVSLQVIVVGVTLSSALRKMKRGDDSGHLPWSATGFVFLVRFVLWPAISISVIYGIAKRTNLLDRDPILWFAMMLMPTGPPAMNLIAMADVNGVDEKEKMVISKLLVICYIVSPIMAFTVVGALSASDIPFE